MARHAIVLLLAAVLAASSLVAANADGVPVYVMLPLNAITSDNQVNNPSQLSSWFKELKGGGVTGVMSDTWWGLTEPEPQRYNFTGYQSLLKLVANAGLKFQAVMSFHSCGGNVGDTCNIPLPSWVLSVGDSHDIFYEDAQGSKDPEYVSLFVDEEPLFDGRTPLQIYSDFMNAYAQAMAPFIKDGTIAEIEVGMGPAGELRYPAYRTPWTFCGIGEFQASGSYALANLKAAATAAGNADWGNGPPDNCGNYNSHLPFTVGFWSTNVDQNNYQSAYGKFFLQWYSGELIAHAERVLPLAQAVFEPLGVPIAGKVSGVHWWYLSPQHAAECTAGYYNTNNNNAYLEIAKAFAKYNADFDFTCMEMTDNESGFAACDSGPVQLVQQAKGAAHEAGIDFSGENALNVYSTSSYQQIEYQSAALGYLINEFTYLRLSSTLFQGNNFATFTSFVKTMAGLSG